MDILSFQYNLHRLLLHLAVFPPGTVCWEDVLLGRHSWLVGRCTECGAGCDRCKLSSYMTHQSYRIGAPSDGVTFGGKTFFLKHVTRERFRWSVAGVSRCGREGAGEEWQVAGMLPVRAS